MKKKIEAVFFTVLFLMSGIFNLFGQEQKTLLVNADILKMVKEGISETLVIQTIDQFPSNYDVSPNALIELKKQGVTNPILEAMSRAYSKAVSKEPAAVQSEEGKKTVTDVKESNEPNEARDRIIAKYISITRLLEQNPFTNDGGATYRWMDDQYFYFDKGVYARECQEVDDLIPEEYEEYAALLSQISFGMIAFKLENPDKKDDEQAAQLAGMESVLKTYESIVARTDSKNAKLDALVDKRNKGLLKAFIYRLASKCKD